MRTLVLVKVYMYMSYLIWLNMDAYMLSWCQVLLNPTLLQEVDLPRKDKPFYRDVWAMCKCADPFNFFDPKIPKQFKYKDCFTAPYNRRCHDK